MRTQPTARRAASGNVYLKKGKKGATWHMRYRLPDGTESRKAIGPAAPGNGRPPEGTFTKRTAQQHLQAFLTDARRGVLPEVQRSGATVKEAVDEWLRYVEDERGVRGTTIREYRTSAQKHLVPAFGDRKLEAVSTRSIEAWKSHLLADGKLSRRTINKLLTNLNGIFERARRVWGLQTNPVEGVERLPDRYDPAKFDFYSPEEVRALVRNSESEQDAAIFLVAAFAGLRMGEVLALTWREIDFANETIRVERQLNDLGQITVTKGGLVRSVPMVEEVATALAKLGQRGWFTGDDDPVFPGVHTMQRIEALVDEEDLDDALGDVVDAVGHMDRSALRKRYKAALKRAGLRALRFHDLRHTFGSLVINEANPVEVQAWMGHADARTTARYLHHKSRAGEAKRIAAAFAVVQPDLERAQAQD
jgi:integrase